MSIVITNNRIVRVHPQRQTGTTTDAETGVEVPTFEPSTGVHYNVHLKGLQDDAAAGRNGMTPELLQQMIAAAQQYFVSPEYPKFSFGADCAAEDSVFMVFPDQSTAEQVALALGVAAETGAVG